MPKISTLPQDTAPTGDDYTVTIETASGQTKKVLLSDMLTYMMTGTLTGGFALNNLTTLSNPYKFRAYLTANQTGLTSDVYTDITLNGESFDTNNNFASNIYTVPVTGYYWLMAKAVLYSSVVGAITGGGIAIFKNGSAISESGNMYDNNVSYDNNFIFMHDLIPLTAGDTIKLQAKVIVSSGTGTIVGGANYSCLAGFLVSKT